MITPLLMNTHAIQRQRDAHTRFDVYSPRDRASSVQFCSVLTIFLSLSRGADFLIQREMNTFSIEIAIVSMQYYTIINLAVDYVVHQMFL